MNEVLDFHLIEAETNVLLPENLQQKQFFVSLVSCDKSCTCVIST